ncbi:CDP-alcohol phosphatidyltransferase family protein [Paraflavisolibacter sp. H34]|uniref:CDP-alcohol phosphatidyltransferase family protein n=1 Tax=Huijunlia imazamoxiresistens TaxID=3127457 RepID=UPI003017C474
MRKIPLLLILFRFLLAPLLLFLAWQYGKTYRELIVWLLFLGLLSDVLDGISARKQEVSSAALRRMDSQTDMIFWLSAGVASWLIWPGVIGAHQGVIYALLGMEAACYAVSLVKFGKETCTHAYLSKFWGLTLLAAFTDLILNGNAGFLFFFCLAAGIISHTDRILITLLLPRWQHDVPSAWHAWRIRQGKPIKKFLLFNG